MAADDIINYKMTSKSLSIFFKSEWVSPLVDLISNYNIIKDKPSKDNFGTSYYSQNKRCPFYEFAWENLAYSKSSLNPKNILKKMSVICNRNMPSMVSR